LVAEAKGGKGMGEKEGQLKSNYEKVEKIMTVTSPGRTTKEQFDQVTKEWSEVQAEIGSGKTR